MVEFTWLHLTDLHTGMDESAHLWPGVEDKFYEDLHFLLVEEQVGPLDMVLFTGDFVQSGRRDEFERVDIILEKLWRQFREMKSAPVLLAVPGNHDLVRPVNTVLNPNPALDTLQYLWDKKSRIRNAFWNNEYSPQRHVVTEALANYVEWYRSAAMPKPDTYFEGMLPGDFSATIEKDGYKLGIVGLNSTYLQLTDGDLRGRLEVNLRQFHSACHGHGDDWVNEHRVCLLMTHHPPEWLSEKAKGYLAEIHDPPHRFAAHLYGHMHESNLTSVESGGANARNFMQGCSLFGLDSWGESKKRLHGYSIGKIKIDDSNGVLQIWPRRALRRQGGSWDMDKDPSFSLPKKDLATPGRSIELLPQAPSEPPPPPPPMPDLGQFRKLKPTIDPILLARLDALQRKLIRIPKWLGSDLENLEAEQRSKRKLQAEVDRAVKKRLNKLNEIHDTLAQPGQNVEAAVNNAWRTYLTINSESQELFRECLELLGGLALRHKGLDDSICWLADEIVSECADDYLGTMYPSFVVLAQQEAINKTMARIVRLRFPEWTVWSLPSTAHEFGHVIIEEDVEGLREFVSSRSYDPRAKKPHSNKWNRYHVYEIVADAFATYMMGPAYACAAISLRLDPLSTTDQTHLADATRAYVIFQVLEWMNSKALDQSGKLLNPYKQIIRRLKTQWNAVLRRVDRSDKPWAAVQCSAKELRELVHSTLNELADVFRENGRYPHTGNTGLEVATKWGRHWSEQSHSGPTESACRYLRHLPAVRSVTR
jgi:hypothetical protein